MKSKRSHIHAIKRGTSAVFLLIVTQISLTSRKKFDCICQRNFYSRSIVFELFPADYPVTGKIDPEPTYEAHQSLLFCILHYCRHVAGVFWSSSCASPSLCLRRHRHQWRG